MSELQPFELRARTLARQLVAVRQAEADPYYRPLSIWPELQRLVSLLVIARAPHIDDAGCRELVAAYSTPRYRHVVRRLSRIAPRIPLNELGQRDGWICYLCSEPVKPKLRRHPFGRHPRAGSTHHIVPVARGGTNDPTNLKLTHYACNVSHGVRDYDPEVTPRRRDPARPNHTAARGVAATPGVFEMRQRTKPFGINTFRPLCGAGHMCLVDREDLGILPETSDLIDSPENRETENLLRGDAAG